MVFGVFDGLHEGHRHFLSEAAKRCETLVVVVARPETSVALKNRPPQESLEERIKKIQEFNPSCTVVPGDSELGQWQIIAEHAPDTVFLGHDQKELEGALTKMKLPCVFLSHF